MIENNHIISFLDEALEEHVFSAYQLAAVCHDKRLNLSRGVTSYWADGLPVGQDTLFDIGSVTKVVAGLTRVLAAQKENGFDLFTPVSELLPEWRGTPFDSTHILNLLNHTSGLIDWLPYYQYKHLSVADYLNQERSVLWQNQPNETARYSDINYWILAACLDRFSNQKIDFVELGKRWFGFARTQYGPVPRHLSVATEYCRWRSKVCHGEVFDENCFAMGGESLHAGLFSTAQDLGKFCQEWLNALWGTSPHLTVEMAQRCVAPSSRLPGVTWGIGWDTKSTVGSSAGTRFSASSFGHLGFTGTSIWVDPERQGYVVFLTNRIHPSRLDTRIRDIRPKLHDLICDWWEGI